MTDVHTNAFPATRARIARNRTNIARRSASIAKSRARSCSSSRPLMSVPASMVLGVMASMPTKIRHEVLRRYVRTEHYLRKAETM